jgi:hypothetical protein
VTGSARLVGLLPSELVDSPQAKRSNSGECCGLWTSTGLTLDVCRSHSCSILIVSEWNQQGNPVHLLAIVRRDVGRHESATDAQRPPLYSRAGPIVAVSWVLVEWEARIGVGHRDPQRDGARSIYCTKYSRHCIISVPRGTR